MKKYMDSSPMPKTIKQLTNSKKQLVKFEDNRAKSSIQNKEQNNTICQMRKITMPNGREIITEHYTSNELDRMIPTEFMQPGTYRQLESLIEAIEQGEVEEDIFTDSESDSENDPAYDGVRITDGRTDKAEFDRIKLKRHKIYEDKTFDLSRIPVEHRQSEDVLVRNWIKKQIIAKIQSKIAAIKALSETDTSYSLRCFEDTGRPIDVLISWFSDPATRKIKIVIAGESEELKRQIATAVIGLRQQFPGWEITVKLGDPKGRLDHDTMHKPK